MAGGERHAGTVKTFNGQWGFVSTPDHEGDVFAHLKDSPGLAALRPGEAVEFDLVVKAGGKHNGAQAVNVARVSAGGAYLDARAGHAAGQVQHQMLYTENGDVGEEVHGPGQQQYMGTVVHFRPEKGWGLLECPSLDDPKLFFGVKDNPMLTGRTLVQGDEIQFDLGANEEGRPRAEHAELALRTLEQLVGCRVRGVIKTFRDGWGFAHSDRFEGDVLLGRATMGQAGLNFGVSQGDVIEFEVAAGTGGQRFQAVAPQLISQAAPRMPSRQLQQVPLIMQMRGPPPVRGHDRSRTPPPMGRTPLAVRQFGMPAPGISARPGQRMSGVIASFKDDWGLLEASSLPERLFFGLRDNPQLSMSDVAEGQPVTFEVGTNPKNGRPRAMNMSAASTPGSRGGSPRGGPPAWATSGGGPPAYATRPPQAPGRISPGSWGGGVVAAGVAGERVQGVVKSFKDGWGFASSDACGGDVLLGRNTLQKEGLSQLLAPGDILEFELRSGANGKWQAEGVRKL